MNKHIDHAKATYNPQAQKSFAGALCAFFEAECPQIGGDRTRQVLVQEIEQMVRSFYPETDHLSPGQTVWPTVCKSAKGGYGKRIKDTPLTSVILTLVQSHDAKDRAEGKKLREMKIDAVARLCREAFDQGGCLTNAELGILLKISPSTAGKYIKEWELANNTVLPRRGTIHDMGPTLTHKQIIIHQLFIEQKSYQQVARDTYHSFEAIQRYMKAFRQVLLCRQKGMSTEEIAYATKMTKRLVLEYEKIIDHYADNGEVLEEILKHQPPIGKKPQYPEPNLKGNR